PGLERASRFVPITYDEEPDGRPGRARREDYRRTNARITDATRCTRAVLSSQPIGSGHPSDPGGSRQLVWFGTGRERFTLWARGGGARVDGRIYRGVGGVVAAIARWPSTWSNTSSLRFSPVSRNSGVTCPRSSAAGWS